MLSQALSIIILPLLLYLYRRHFTLRHPAISSFCIRICLIRNTHTCILILSMTRAWWLCANMETAPNALVALIKTLQRQLARYPRKKVFFALILTKADLSHSRIILDRESSSPIVPLNLVSGSKGAWFSFFQELRDECVPGLLNHFMKMYCIVRLSLWQHESNSERLIISLHYFYFM